MGIHIEVGDKWVITSDQYQFILSEKKVAKTGKTAGSEWLCTISYYPKISQLIAGLQHYNIQQSAITSLSDMAAEIERVGAICESSIRELKND